jgi:dephospho-CoA kinase
MIKVGLTGNIGTGKTTVARIFEVLGVPVFHADLVARELLEKSSVKQLVQDQFGKEIFINQMIDRKQLANLVFNDPKKLNILNSIIHPRVKAALLDWMNQNADHPYIIQEAAILFESGFYKDFDKVILVTSSVELANRRVMERDSIDLKSVEARRSNQWSQDKKEGLSDFIIRNDEDDMILPQVLEIHNKLLRG